MSYQEECELYAIFGDNLREHLDYEFNSRYDRYDGLRMDFGTDYGMEIYEPSPEERAESEAWLEKVRRAEWNDGTEVEYEFDYDEFTERFYHGSEEVPF